MYLAQTTLEVDTTKVATLRNNKRDIKIYLMNKGKSFIVASEFETQGRDCRLYLSADYNPKKNITK